ncbi:OTU1 [Candida oxycetoniae]|uniref:Ubiquitin thioesterase OTU n=1 Tax=Candida oxycetoniae TaxID=497107 RepID=A0AAI9SXJ9_9ASCO|nr:OTU1 [Candida oxycetoniae]KAI3404951.2 OTU1 [Candida oxycetoniae]
MRLKLKADGGVATINVDPSHLFKDFLSEIQLNKDLHTDVSEVVTSVKTGFPPKPIDLSYSLTESISDKGINDGDQLLISFASMKRKLSASSDLEESSRRKEVQVATCKNDGDGGGGGDGGDGGDDDDNPPSKKADTREDIPAVYMNSLKKYLILRNIPDDNSCLFNSVSYAISGASSYKSVSPPEELRKVVVSYIEKNAVLYSDTILGRPRKEYCEWILKKDSWGGAIELGILADWFDVQITCVDIESGNFIKIKNEEQNPTKFILLIYSGVHYDVLAINSKLSTKNKDTDECVWELNTNEEKTIIDATNKLCKLLQEKNYSTNTTTFRVRCLDCYSILIGEVGASKHAEQTGHLNFGEVKKD